ncbi:MAG: TraR/DksA family transcriptional regulator [Candidatus Brocadiaceae bacterium]|nr:TraR/DksA family transcriptional regulator [Candidatus Brocadiaceae bacterium]
MKKYEQIRKKLIKKRDEIELRLNNIDKDLLHINGAPDPDFEEQTVERQNDEVLDAVGELTRSELEKINSALARLEQGEYGICAECKSIIPVERLKAIPYVEHCVSCSE